MKDVRQEITNQIISQLESVSIGDYQKPWFNIKGLPSNPVTKSRYHGINALCLQSDKFDHLEYASYKQWQSIGAQVKQGEHGSMVVFYKPIEIKDKQTEELKKIPLLKYSTVFNCSQVEGYTPKTTELNTHESIEQAELFASNCQIATEYKHDRACFIPSANLVQMPKLGQFNTPGDFYSVLFHEYTHATGHKSRLDRDQKGRFGGSEYAFEELIAELGSAFTMAHLNLEQSPRTDHAIYIKSWLQALKSDNKFIFSAAGKAQAACDYLIAQQTESELKEAA